MFVCNYHGGLDQGDLDQGEITLSVNIEGNPAYYVPGHMYQGKALFNREVFSYGIQHISL